jgi:hypothetical protein
VYWPVLVALSTGMRHPAFSKAPKNDKSRVITVPRFALEELRRIKRQQAEELLVLGVRQTSNTLVCCRTIVSCGSIFW